jgi:hypothetical protein
MYTKALPGSIFIDTYLLRKLTGFYPNPPKLIKILQVFRIFFNPAFYGAVLFRVGFVEQVLYK